MMCSEVTGSRRSGRRSYPVRCNEEATCGAFCPYHWLKSKMDGVSRLMPHREFVAGLPMPGFEALRELAREVGL